MVTLVSTSELLVEFEMITITAVELSLEEVLESVPSDPVVVVISFVAFAVQLALKVEASMTLEASA